LQFVRKYKNLFNLSNYLFNITQHRVSQKAITVEMGGMSDYDIRPKAKIWTGSPNKCQTWAECYMLG